jgi:hypothetical protein
MDQGSNLGPLEFQDEHIAPRTPLKLPRALGSQGYLVACAVSNALDFWSNPVTLVAISLFSGFVLLCVKIAVNLLSFLLFSCVLREHSEINFDLCVFMMNRWMIYHH